MLHFHIGFCSREERYLVRLTRDEINFNGGPPSSSWVVLRPFLKTSLYF